MLGLPCCRHLKNFQGIRKYSASIGSQSSSISINNDPLLKCLEQKIDAHRETVIKFRKEHGKTKIGDINVNMLYGGMRGMKALITETSLLSPDEGIRFRGLTIEDCQLQLPKATPDGCEPLPEGIFWLLMTGDVPNEEQVKFLSNEWAKRCCLPKHVETMLDTMPNNVHPMAQLSAACSLCNVDSKFVKYYHSDKFDKKEAWRPVYEDVMDLIGKLVPICAKIYTNTYKSKTCEFKPKPDQDWTLNYCEAIEMTSPQFVELMRMYFTIHCDHEGGNVSAHTTHLVGSALSDAYLSYAAGMNGLAGPLHGLANQEVLRFLDELRNKVGDQPNEDEVKKFCEDTLNSGKVIPGYGHAVLRKTDPRYMCQQKFALKHLPDDPLFNIVNTLFKVVPPILKSLGKVQNPWPNVDAHSGVLLQYYGLCEKNYYTVLFAMSRALGVLSSLVWDRALLFPLERPKSITTEALIELVGGGGKKDKPGTDSGSTTKSTKPVKDKKIKKDKAGTDTGSTTDSTKPIKDKKI